MKRLERGHYRLPDGTGGKIDRATFSMLEGGIAAAQVLRAGKYCKKMKLT